MFLGSTGQLGSDLGSAADASTFDFGLSDARKDINVEPGNRRRRRRDGGHKNRSDGVDRELVGLIGEAYVYELFKARLPDFDESGWRSENRERYGLGSGDDGLGYDFYYRDGEGNLSGRKSDVACYIEVKSSSGDALGPFEISINEWEKAQECSEEDGSLYIIVRVSDVLVNPDMVDAIHDPFKLRQQGQIELRDQNMWVHVGAREQVSNVVPDPRGASEAAEE
ncbi:MAG: DUF3883 domain-containing protein [Chloroflexi bacterium]|nr:DUF3883 domain-containing protein [Chloroflexota bacterium]